MNYTLLAKEDTHFYTWIKVDIGNKKPYYKIDVYTSKRPEIREVSDQDCLCNLLLIGRQCGESARCVRSGYRLVCFVSFDLRDFGP